MSQTCAGEASTGKTQTCMQLLMTAQWPAAEGGLDGDALCASPCFALITLSAALPCFPYQTCADLCGSSDYYLLTLGADTYALKAIRQRPDSTR